MKMRYKTIIGSTVLISIVWWVNNVFSIVELGPAMGLFSSRNNKGATLVTVPGRIIFHSDRLEHGVYKLEDGRIEKFIEHGGLAKLSSDGKKILYFKSGGRITIKNLTTNTDERVIFFPKGYEPTAYDWSPDVKKICFTADPVDDKKSFDNLFLYDIYTEEIKQLTFFEGNTPWSVTNPKWSHDGKMIAFHCPKNIEKGDTGAPISIFIINEDGTGLKEIFGDKHWGGGEPSWSPDCKQLVFTSHLSGEKYDDIFICNIDGSGLTRLSNDYWQDRNPVFSPDGKKICYVSPRHGNILFGSELFVVNIDGTGQARLTSPLKRKDPSPLRKWVTDDYPQWSK